MGNTRLTKEGLYKIRCKYLYEQVTGLRNWYFTDAQLNAILNKLIELEKKINK